MGIKLRTKSFRALFFIIGDIISILLGLSGARLIFELANFSQSGFPGLFYPVTFLAASLAGLTYFGMYKVSWRYTSLKDLVKIFMGSVTGLVLFLGICFLIGELSDRTLLFGTTVFVLSFCLIGAFRISRRMYLEIFRKPSTNNNVIVFGAGNACDQILRDIMRNNAWELNVSYLFDDDENLHGLNIHGTEVLGGSEVMYDYLRDHHVSQLIVAAPSLPKKRLKKIINKVKSLAPELKIKVVPSFHRLSDDPIGVKNIRDIQIEDILGRESASVNMTRISHSLKGKRVLITGAGGSIGSEIVRQCSNLPVKEFVALDIDETELYHLENKLSEGKSDNFITVVADVTDEHKMEAVFKKYRPDVVYHAAAYKHVPMMERFPEEAIKVNVGGTRAVAALCCKYSAEKFILISTDKAVNPTNVMGATKRVAEQICMAYNDYDVTKFISVRFGNVLGSRGSVVPLFMEQINNGGPVTITDPEIERYFMTIPEAVLLVMQAGDLGDGGEVFVLDMGEPVKILDMAKELIRLNGLEPGTDIPLVFKGLRPGEKMYEELLNKEEGAIQTVHEQIYKASCNGEFSINEIDTFLDELFTNIHNENFDSLRNLLKRVVPKYKFNGELEKIS